MFRSRWPRNAHADGRRTGSPGTGASGQAAGKLLIHRQASAAFVTVGFPEPGGTSLSLGTNAPLLGDREDNAAAPEQRGETEPTGPSVAEDRPVSPH